MLISASSLDQFNAGFTSTGPASLNHRLYTLMMEVVMFTRSLSCQSLTRQVAFYIFVLSVSAVMQSEGVNGAISHLSLILVGPIFLPRPPQILSYKFENPVIIHTTYKPKN